MDEERVRALVRAAIARHHGPVPHNEAAVPSSRPAREATPVAPSSPHASVTRFHLVRPVAEVECIIEPAVTCNHCGHCECFGH